MKRRILALALVFAMAFGLFGCGQKPVETQPPTEPPVTTAPTEPPVTEPSPEELYSAARKAIDEAVNLELTLATEKTITVGGESFSLVSDQVITLAGLGSDALQVSMSEELDLNGYQDSFDEYFTGETLYTTVYDTYHFKGTMTQEEYLARFAPAVLLDAALYGELTSAPEGDGTRLSFAAPSAGESWALPEEAEFVSAGGSALISADGALIESVYTIEYSYGAAHVSMTVTAAAAAKDSVSIAAPDEQTQYTELSYIDAPRVYDMAVMYLYSTNSVSSILSETIVSQAAGCIRSDQTTLNYHGTGDDHVSEITYDVSLTHSEGTDTYTQTEYFQNNKYSISMDGSEPEEQTLAAVDMYDYCQTYLEENVIALDYITAMEATELGGLIYLELACSEEYGDFLNGYANSVLFSDEEFLNSYASAYASTECGGYMVIDQYTGFPTAVGIAYSGTHTIDGIDYVLSLQADQSFNLASMTSYASVTGEPLPETEPENKATPLFYHVTGENGQEMWLLGTIHVGDERTAFLPQEIYDALAASSALAVEFDTQAFEEALETDTYLLSQISASYFYSDGSTTKDHLDEDIYEDAVKLLKASGNYNANAEYMKPYLWSQSIDNFYLQLGYDLVADKGVDSRLLTLAKEMGMEIRDIESGIFQIQMMTGYSDALQELLLEESISYTSAEYCASTNELYEMWCAGDEAGLREELSDAVDTSEFTEEELAEYEAQLPLIEEYNKAMSHDRNDGMLQVAISYLESGETIFYAVGLAHLLNDTNGLVDTLREAGYTVELVTYN